MKVPKQISLPFLLLSLFALGCSPRYYIPNTQNVPIIRSAGQVNASLAANGNQVELQGAYGLSDHVGVQLNSGLYFPRNLDNGNGGSGGLVEAGLGLGKMLGEHGHVDVYGLAAYGRLENHLPSTLEEYPATTGNISSNVYRFGLQPSLSFLARFFSVTGSARLASLNYGGTEGSLVFDGVDQVSYLNANSSHLLLEPAITLRFGLERAKLQIQALKSFNLTDPGFRQDDLLITGGLNFTFL